MDKWNVVGVVAEGMPIRIGPIENVWQHRWTSVKKPAIQLQHPSHPNQLHAFDIYKIEDENLVVVFAAGELSMNVWGFYEPESKADKID